MDDVPLDGPGWARGLLEALDMRRVRDPFSAEGAAALVASTWLPGAFDADLPLAAAEGMVDAIGSIRRTSALVLLRGLAAVAPDPLAARAGAAADALVAAGVREPRWLPLVGRAVVTGCWRMHHVLGDGDNIVVACRYPDGQEHTLVVYIDHNLGTLVKDVFPAGPSDEILAAFAEAAEDDPDVSIDPIAPAEAAARITAALARSDVTIPPIESEDYPATRPVLDARLATMPTGGEVPAPPELTARQRDALVEVFLVSPSGTRWAGDDDAAWIAEQLVRFRCDYGDGRPLRWSPPVVELLLTDWFARKVVADRDVYAKVPDVLADWVTFAAAETGLRPVQLDDTLTAIGMFGDEFLGQVDGRSAAPGVAAVAALAGLLDATGDPASWHDLLGGPTDSVPSPAPQIEPAPFVWRGIPADLHPRVETIATVCDRACEQVLDGEYQDLARRLVAKLARKRPSPLRRGDPTIWAGGVLYALGQVNFLFARKAACHVTGKRLAEVVGAKPGSVAQKAKVVRDAAGLRDFDPDFTRRELLDMGPVMARFFHRY